MTDTPREMAERALTKAYHKGVTDGLRHGPIVAHWDYPPKEADEFCASLLAAQERVRELEEALREIDAGIFIDNGDVTALPVYAVRGIIARDHRRKPG